MRHGESSTLSRDEFADLLRTYERFLRVVAAGEVGYDDADDVVQQAAINALARLGRFERGTDFRAWMGAFVRGAGKNHRRSQKRHRERVLRLADRSPRGDSQDVQGSLVECSEIRAEIRSAVDALGPLRRSCFLLRTVMDHPYQDIAGMLGIPEATARSHVYRARTELARALAGKEEHA
ncbi:MAG: RNA polymerase sigma factor [Planctomycetota bacterium]